MTTLHLDQLFAPKSIAVLGADKVPGKPGTVVMQNLMREAFDGPVLPVSARHASLHGVMAYADVDALPLVPDLAVICTSPALVVPGLQELGEKGCRAALVLTGGLARTIRPDGVSIKQAMLATARAHGIRLMGSDCPGLLAPRLKLNASFAHRRLKPGKLAFVSQSGALSAAVMDWAVDHDIGFSYFITLGDSDNVDFGDVIDFLGSDPHTRAILLYIETVQERRNFMSAARAAARNKPVLCVKSGRSEQSAAAAAPHTGALTGSDDIFDAALRRAGVLRVYTIQELFQATETLARMKPILNNDLTIVTNGGGPGVLAADALTRHGGRLSELKTQTLETLVQILPADGSCANPVDLTDTATGETYAAAISAILDDKSIGSLLVMFSPTASAPTTTRANEAAQGVIEALRRRKRNILTAWIGGSSVSDSRAMFHGANIPTFTTPEHAVAAWTHMVSYKKLQDVLMEVPASVPEEFDADTAAARTLIKSVLDEGREMLTEPEAKRLLQCYGIPCCRTETAATVEEAVKRAGEIGYPVALKILSKEISHKSAHGGVVLNIENEAALRRSGETMLRGIKARFPKAAIDGVTVQEMLPVLTGFELMIGARVDPVFGPVILFGDGGTAVELLDDTALGLPPLNMKLAAELIDGTRIAKRLRGCRGIAGVNRKVLELALVRTSQLLIDLAEVTELDINPILATDQGVIGLDARIKVAATDQAPEDRLAIRPYPKHLEKTVTFEDGFSCLLRPILPEDEPDHYAFMRKVSAQDIHFRFFGAVRELPHSEMARLTQLDYDREMAFVAKLPDGTHKGGETVGVVRVAIDVNNTNAEYAILVRSDLKGHGLGRVLMEEMIDYCRKRGTRYFVGQVLTDNRPMLALCEQLGFSRKYLPEEEVFEVTLPLRPKSTEDVSSTQKGP